MNTLFKILSIIFFLFITKIGISQEKQYKIGCIAFYNLENLFDTIDQPNNDEEFLPKGANKWTSEKYHQKLANMARALAQIGDEMVKTGPSVIGVSEIENKGILVDLLNTPPLKGMGYDFVHYDSPDRRGVDVALLYQPSIFKVTSSKSVRYINPKDTSFRTRDQLVVTGIFDGEPMSFIVNHWPSRRGKSGYLRCLAGNLARSIVDSLQTIDPQAKIVIMGDLNDDPTDPSLTKCLGAKCSQKDVQPKELFNTMCPVFTKEGVGSLGYRDNWNLFDQIIISEPFLGNDRSSFKFYQAKVCNKKFLTTQDGQYAGYPFRTFSNGVFINGFSDHYPTYIFIAKEIKP